MAITREQIQKDVAKLLKEGFDLLVAETSKQRNGKPEERKAARTRAKPKAKAATDPDTAPEPSPSTQQLPLQVAYQSWYTLALPLVKLVLPDRYAEFVEQYKLEKRKDIDFVTYTISDYLIGLRVTRGIYKEDIVNPLSAFTSKFQHQIFILRSCSDRLDSALSEIRATMQAELFDDELEAAIELSKKGHLRAAGALAGVTLERHLGAVVANHGIKISKAHPTIADLNDALKQASVLQVPDWRFVQRLGDLRNLAAHAKDREPTSDDINELVDGVRKIVKALF